MREETVLRSECLENMESLRAGFKDEIRSATTPIAESLESIDKRLFHDNGTKSHQTKINNLEQNVKLLLWLGGIMASATLMTGMVSLVKILAKGF